MPTKSKATTGPTPAQIVNDPELFAKHFLKILIVERGTNEKRLIPFYWNDAQRNFHQNRTGRDLVLKARQLGFSTYVQGEMFRRAVTSTRTTFTFAHDDETTQKLRLMADRFWENCRFNEIQPLRRYSNATMATYPEFDSMASIGTAGSVQKGRGATYTDLHGSEVAFWKDARSIIAGAMQGGNPDVVLESTPNGAQGYFYDLCMEALHNLGVWKLHFYPWWWEPHYKIALEKGEQIVPDDEEKHIMHVNNFVLSPEQIKWRRNKIKELKSFFSQEYPEDPVTCFLKSGFGYFGDLTDVFTAPTGAVYDPGHRYAAGLDFGQTVDYTAMPVLDFTTKQQVDLLHINNLPWAEQRRRIKQTYDKWHLNSVLAEKNSIGDPNIEALRAMGVNVIEFETTNESKASIVSSWNEALHYGGWKMMDIPVQRAEHQAFVATQLPSGAWKLAAEGDGHDDIVIGNSLAYRHGVFVTSDRDLENYGKNINEVVDDDIIAMRADTLGISFEEAKKKIEKENKR